MENELKNIAEKQQEMVKNQRFFKKTVQVTILLIAGMLLGEMIGCYSCERGNGQSSYEDRIVNSVDEAITEAVKAKETVDGMKVNETKTRVMDSIGLYRKGEKWGFYNLNTEKVLVRNSAGIPKEYDNVGFYSEGLAAVLQDGKIGFVDIEGKQVIPFQYLSRTNKEMKEIAFHYGYCRMAGRDGRLGVIDKRGNWAIKPIYEALKMTETCVYASTATSRVQLNYNGTVMQSDLIVRVEALDTTGYNVYYVQDALNKERCGIMDNTGKRLTEPIYRRVEKLSPELFRCYFLDGTTMEVLHFPAIEKKQ